MVCRAYFTYILTIANRLAGLSPRAGHDSRKIEYIHGSLFNVRCSAFLCDYTETNNFNDPIVPALAIPIAAPEPTPSGSATSGERASESLSQAMDSVQKELDISDDSVKIAQVETKDLPQCPKCGSGLLRPDVVWFGEALAKGSLEHVDEFIRAARKIDLMIVIGTSAKVFPAADYINIARSKGARVAVINMEKYDELSGRGGFQRGDWFFQGDASVIVPELFKGEIGDLDDLTNGPS